MDVLMYVVHWIGEWFDTLHPIVQLVLIIWGFYYVYFIIGNVGASVARDVIGAVTPRDKD
jgi:hypothetical protein